MDTSRINPGYLFNETRYQKVVIGVALYWFAYDAIKNMIMQIMINVPQILIWPIRPNKSVSVPNLKLFVPMKTELWA